MVGYRLQGEVSDSSSGESSKAQVEADEEEPENSECDDVDGTLRGAHPEADADTDDDDYQSAPEVAEMDAGVDAWVQMQVQKELDNALGFGLTQRKKRTIEH